MSPKKKNIDSRVFNIAAKIKKLRIDKGYSSYEVFAWEHNISRAQYFRIENGANITLNTFLKVLDAHGITPEEFFSGEI